MKAVIPQCTLTLQPGHPSQGPKSLNLSHPDDDMHGQLTLPFAPPQLLHSPLAGVEWYLPIGYATNSDEREG